MAFSRLQGKLDFTLVTRKQLQLCERVNLISTIRVLSGRQQCCSAGVEQTCQVTSSATANLLCGADPGKNNHSHQQQLRFLMVSAFK